MWKTCFSNVNLSKKKKKETIKIDTVQFSKWLHRVEPLFQNFEYLKNGRWVIRFFHFRIYCLFVYLFWLFEYSKYRIIYKIGNLWNRDSFPNCKILKIFEIFEIDKFCYFPNCKFLEFPKINKFRDFFNLENQNLTSKISNCGIVRPFDIPHYSQFCRFSYLPFDIDQFFQFLFPILVTRRVGRSTFERSLIF